MSRGSLGKIRRPYGHEHHDNRPEAQLFRSPPFIYTRQTICGQRKKRKIDPSLHSNLFRKGHYKGNRNFPGTLFLKRLHSTQKRRENSSYNKFKNLNQYLIVPKFKMETVAQVSKCILENLWGIIDLKDAFFLIPIAWLFHKYFAFVIDNRILVFQYMPFGLSLAPWYQKVTQGLMVIISSTSYSPLGWLSQT